MKARFMNDKPTVFITGAARGIGRATALEFARRGYDIALLDRLDDELKATADEIEQTGTATLSYCGDITDFEFAESAIRQTAERWGRLDVLVNNAMWREQSTMRQISIQSWEKTLRIGLTAPAFLARWAAEIMEPRGSGVIVNVSSVNAEQPRGNAPAYVAAKGGLESLTYELAALFGPSGIRVVAVEPGAIDTDLSNDYTDADGESITTQMRKWSEDMIPLKRWGQPEDIARTIAMLASDDAAYITGTTIVADGGWSRNSMPQSMKRQMDPDQFR